MTEQDMSQGDGEKQEEENSSKKYIVKYNRNSCIGVFACTAILPDVWKVAADGKADLKGSAAEESGEFELEISREQLPKMLESAEACPVNVIHIMEKDTGRKLI